MSINEDNRRSDDDRRDVEGRRELIDRRITEAEEERNLLEATLLRKQTDRRNIVERRED